MSKRLRSPEVMLLIDTSRVFGRESVEGMGCYAAECGPWSICPEDRGLFDPLPPLLKGWQGDAILARSVHKADRKRLLATGLPLVDLFADFALARRRCAPTRMQSAGWWPIIFSIGDYTPWPSSPASGPGGAAPDPRAQMLLWQTDMSVEQVFKRSGFATLGYFVRAFRRETGITPRRYRGRCRVADVHTSSSDNNGPIGRRGKP